MMFKDTPVESVSPDTLVIRIQPDAGIQLTIMGRAEPPRMMKCHLAPDRSLTPALSPRARGMRSALRATFTVSFAAKIPGPSMRVGTVNMDFCYADYFGNEPSTGYKTLI
jgi:glucose-6-phosphate 1-dehydrogenase